MKNNEIYDMGEFTYDLPDEKIAKFPKEERESSKLLVYNNGAIIDETFKNCTQYIPPHSLLIFNNTKVIHARIFLQKSTGASIEIFCIEPHTPSNYEENLQATTSCQWLCLVRNVKKWKHEILSNTLHINNSEVCFTAKKMEIRDTCFLIEFSWTHNIPFADILDAVGKIPIPPYLQRESLENDATTYQTIYAKHKGSVAAPTAGLHFSDTILKQIKKNGIEIMHVTLHVGAGTFKPVSTDSYKDHTMHREFFTVPTELLEKIQLHSHGITAVGTTSVRTLESVYWLGVKLLETNHFPTELHQWEAYSLPQHYSLHEAIGALIEYAKLHNLESIHAYTQIMIVPGYTFRMVSQLFTNFHQPQSTLLLLIAAFVGDTWKDIYSHALHNNYRFLSYGDSSLLHRK